MRMNFVGDGRQELLKLWNRRRGVAGTRGELYVYEEL